MEYLSRTVRPSILRAFQIRVVEQLKRGEICQILLVGWGVAPTSRHGPVRPRRGGGSPSSRPRERYVAGQGSTSLAIVRTIAGFFRLGSVSFWRCPADHRLDRNAGSRARSNEGA